MPDSRPQSHQLLTDSPRARACSNVLFPAMSVPWRSTRTERPAPYTPGAVDWLQKGEAPLFLGKMVRIPLIGVFESG